MRAIDADALKEEIDYYIREAGWGETHNEALRWCLEFIDNQPAIEPQRKTGEWQVTDAYPHNVYCSECHKKFAQTHWAVWEDGSLPRNYCPNCGADMRGENDDIPDDIPMEYFENGGV